MTVETRIKTMGGEERVLYLYEQKKGGDIFLTFQRPKGVPGSKYLIPREEAFKLLESLTDILMHNY